MSYINPKRLQHNRRDARSRIRDALQNDARIFAIMAEDDAESERSFEYRFTKQESKEIFRFIRDNIFVNDPA